MAAIQVLSGLVYGCSAAVIIVWSLFLKDYRWVGLFCALAMSLVLLVTFTVKGLVDRIFDLTPTQSGVLDVAILVIATWVMWAYFLEDYHNAMTKQHGEKCRRCGRRGTRKRLGSSTSTHASTVTRTRTTRHYRADGEETGHSEYDYEVPVTVEAVTTKLQCSACGYEWVEIR